MNLLWNVNINIIVSIDHVDLAKKILLKFRFSKKATKMEEIFAVDLTLCSKCQIVDEYFVKFCDLLRKHEH